MKNLSIKMMVGGMLLTSIAFQSLGQAPMVSTEEGGKMPAKIEKTKVPKEVIVTHTKECPSPTTMNEYWYGYPAFSNESDWYGYNPYLYSDVNPEYYIVEYTKDEKPHKVIYSKEGKKIATHRKYNSDLPSPVSKAIGNGTYKNWKMTSETEEIFKDKDYDVLKVYKVIVEKGTEKHALFYMSDGKFIKDKKIKS